MIDLVKSYLADGYKCWIYTARLSNVAQAADAEKAIRAWCLHHIGVELPVTCIKRTDFIKFYDDRAVHVIKNTGILEGDFNV